MAPARSVKRGRGRPRGSVDIRELPIAEAAALMAGGDALLASAQDLRAAVSLERSKEALRRSGAAHRSPTHGYCYDVDCEICARRDRNALRRREDRAARFGCRCGQSDCDCAEWDRIFREKFEDPTYYEKRVMTPGSSLGE